MSVLLYLLGILSLLGGIAAIGFGVPVKEFSFGNTLILAGATGLVGGLIVIGLAAAISQLQRIGEMLGARPLAKAGRLDPFEAPARVPFPPKPKAQRREGAALEPPPAPHVAEDRGEREPAFTAPSLRNPDVPLMGEEEAQELPLSPRYVGNSRRERADELAPDKDAGAVGSSEQASFEPAWRSPPKQSEPAYSEKMWSPAGRGSAPQEQRASWSESIPRPPAAPEPTAESEPLPEEEMPVAILKSGVVDGMGYTLYVDGSIEAELPGGTLRFASINELRKHLEENSRN
jgi:hypothetical protein